METNTQTSLKYPSVVNNNNLRIMLSLFVRHNRHIVVRKWLFSFALFRRGSGIVLFLHLKKWLGFQRFEDTV